MAALERVMQMKNEGYSESQIIDSLKQEGVSPKEIYNALTQSTIKSELSQSPVAEEAGEMEQREEPYQDPGALQDQQYNPYSQSPQDYNQQYPGYQEYQAPQQQTDIETINEIAEQMVEEKTVELKKTISSFKSYNEETRAEFERITKRLERLENNFGELQVAILRKIGEYGENIKNISSEMHETQDSFSKILNPLTDNIRELQKLTGEKKQQNQKQQPKEERKNKEEIVEKEAEQQPREPKTKPEPGFKDYLR